MQLAANVKETTATTGTGTLALDGPVAGFCSFAAMAEGAQVPYRVQIGAVYEVGLGTVLENASETGYELTRDIVLMASGHDGYLDGNSIDLTAAQVDLPAGDKEVFAVALDLSMVAQNIDMRAPPRIPYRADATGSNALAIGSAAHAHGDQAVAIGRLAGAIHDNAVSIGNVTSMGSGLFCCGARRNGDQNGHSSWFGNTLYSFVSSFSAVNTLAFPDYIQPVFSAKLTILVVDPVDGNYLGELRYLVIDGATLVVTQALTQVYSTRSAPPALTVSLVTAAGETAVVAAVSGGLAALRVMIKTEVFGSP